MLRTIGLACMSSTGNFHYCLSAHREIGFPTMGLGPQDMPMVRIGDIKPIDRLRLSFSVSLSVTINVAFPVEKSSAFHTTISLFPFAETNCTMGAFPRSTTLAQNVFSEVAYLPCLHSSHVVRPGEFAMLFPGQDWQPLPVPFFPTEHFEQDAMPRNSVV